MIHTQGSDTAEYTTMTRTLSSRGETMLHERGLLPILYEGLFLALALQLAAQGLQSTERGEFLHSPSMISLPEASQQVLSFFLPSFHV
jgi:hypothetical protein